MRWPPGSGEQVARPFGPATEDAQRGSGRGWSDWSSLDPTIESARL